MVFLKKKVIWNAIRLVAVVLFLLLPFGNVGVKAEEGAKEWDASALVSPDRDWTIRLSSFVDVSSLSNTSVYVTDSAEKKIESIVSIGESNDEIIVSPPNEGYMPGEVYTLHITNQLIDIDGNNLKEAIVKTFTIERDDADSVTLADDLVELAADDITIVEDIKSGMQGARAEQFELSAEKFPDLSIGDIIFVEASDAFPQGLARKVETMTETNGVLLVTTTIPYLDEVVSDLDINQTVTLSSEYIDEDSLLEGVSVQNFSRYDAASGRAVGGLRYLFNNVKVENSASGSVTISGTIEFVDAAMNFDATIKEFNQFSLGGKLVSSISVDAKYSNKLSASKKMNDIEIPLGALMIPTPAGVTFSANLNGVLSTTLNASLNATLKHELSMEFGVARVKNKIKPLTSLDNQVSLTGSGSAEVGLTLGVKKDITAGLFMIDMLTLTNTAGFEGDIGLYGGFGIGETNYAGVCVDAKVHAFDKISYWIGLSSFTIYEGTFKEFKSKDKKYDNCLRLNDIAFVQQELTLDSNTYGQLDVNAKLVNLKTGKITSEKITNKVVFTSSDKGVEISRNGKVYALPNQAAKTVTITATYLEDNVAKVANVVVNVNKDPRIPDFPEENAMVTAPYEVNFELTNTTSSGKSLRLMNAADYVTYDARGRVVRQSKTNRSVHIPANGVAIVSFYVKPSEPIQVPDGVMIKSTDEEAYLNVYQQGAITSEWTNTSDSSVLVRVEKSIYDYVVYDSKNKVYSFNHRNNLASTFFIPAGGKARITSMGNLVNASAPSRHVRVEASNNPALVKQDIPAGATYSFTNIDASSNSVKVTGASTYDYVTYKKNGSSTFFNINRVARAYPSTFYTSSGDKAVVTNTGTQSLKMYAPATLFTVAHEQEEALSTVTIGAGETYSFTNNQTFGSRIKLKGASTHDYVIYRKNGSPRTYFKDSKSTYHDPLAGDKTVVTNTGAQSLTVYFPSNMFDVAREQEKALSLFVIGAGGTYSFTNNQAFGSSIKLAGARTYDYVMYRKNGSARAYYKDQKLSTLHPQAGEKTVITNMGVLPFMVYVPSNLFDVTREQEKALSTFTIGAGETYSLTNNQEYNNTIKLAGIGSYDYAIYRKNGDLRTSRAIQMKNSSTITPGPGEKTVVTNTGFLSLTMYIPSNIFSVTKGGSIILAGHPDEIGEMNVSIIDATSVQVTFDTEVHDLVKEQITVFNTNDFEEQHIQEMIVAEDGKSILIIFQQPFISKSTYNLTIQVGEETYSSEFEYEAGDVVNIVATDFTVPANVPTTIDYKVLDENDLDITSSTTVVIKATEGIVNDADKTIDLAAGTALVTIEAIDENGVVIGSLEITVTVQATE